MAAPFLFLLVFSLSTSLTLSEPPPISGLLLDCGAVASFVDDRGLRWIPDDDYISSGQPRNLSIQGLYPTLSTLRSFPYHTNRSSPSPSQPIKFCYALPTYRGSRYLIRTSYFYGGPGDPPLFDQIVDGTFWTVVNTSADYAAGSASYYEGVFLARGKFMSVCVAGNPNYTKSDPFISALELIMLNDSVYNATDFGSKAMGLIARSKFGATGLIERYPDDGFDRYWQPYIDTQHAITSTHNITTTSFWNLPPPDIFNTALAAEKNNPLFLQWPQVSLPNSTYYIALYFADTLPNSSRIFTVFVNEYQFYSGPVTSDGLVVFSANWILNGLTSVTLAPLSSLPPVISAGEIFGLFSVQNLTHTRDIISLVAIKEEIKIPPVDWSGDPCMPREYSWTGVTCSGGDRIRVVSLNLSNMGLSGSISDSIANLTALTDISFANNNFTGNIPDLSSLKNLEKLHLQNNQLTGQIPESLGNIGSLRELFLQNNNLSGQVPPNLLNRTDLNLRLHPGNHFSPDPPVP